MEFTLLWAAGTAVAAMALGVRVWPAPEVDSPLDTLLGASFAGLVGGRIAAMLIQGTNPITNPGDFIIIRGGVETGVAAAIALVALFVLVGRRISAMDALAPSALLGLAGWHLGCLWRGACLGTESDLPWAWAEAGSSITRHPVEIYTALALTLAAVIVTKMPARIGFISGLALLMASGIRLATEPLRLNITGGPVAWYATGVLIGLVVAIVAASRGARST